MAAALLLVLPAPAGAGSAWTSIGRSVQDRPIKMHRSGERDAAVSVVVIGCIHGNECAGRAILRALRDMGPIDGLDLRTIGTVNPDGARARTRQNARGVDLNRNFGHGWREIGEPWDTYHSGSAPFSEPETRAVRRLIERLRPEITIWYHQHMALVAKVRRHLSTQRRYARAVGLPLKRLERLPGTASRWQNHRWPGHLSFVVELPAGPLTARSARRHARAVLEAGNRWPTP